MDPNVALNRIRAIAKVDWTGYETDDLSREQLVTLHNDHVQICDLVQGLDEWIWRGGFLPTQWRRR